MSAYADLSKLLTQEYVSLLTNEHDDFTSRLGDFEWDSDDDLSDIPVAVG